jgi:hypothetical protein
MPFCGCSTESVNRLLRYSITKKRHTETVTDKEFIMITTDSITDPESDWHSRPHNRCYMPR